MTNLLHIADRVLNRPLLLHPSKAEIILHVLAGRMGVSGVEPPALEPEANRMLGQPKVAGRSIFYNVIDGAAVITIDGSLVNRGAWVGANSGLVAYEGIEGQITAALGDANVRSIVFDINSPGGEATGMYALAAKVRSAASIKPVVALVNDMAASAAYGLAAQANSILVSPTSIVGSIGVVLLHMDRSQEMAAAGRVPTFIYAGKHKVDGNPFAPLSDEVRADLQAEVETFYDRFVEVVAAGRAGAMTADEIRATEARTYLGEQAIKLGLADNIGVLADAVKLGNALADNLSRTDMAGRPTGMSPLPAPAAGPTEEDSSMDWKDLTAEGLRQHRPDLVTAIEASHDVSGMLATARTEATAAAATAERARIESIREAAFPGQESLAAEMIADGKTTPQEAALRFNQDLKAKGPDHVAALRAADAQVRVPANPTAGAPGVGEAKTFPQTPEGWKAEYEASDKLRSEFVAAEHYVAFMKASTAGRDRVLIGTH